ncbi:hypothetical protein N9260_01400 [bacterium]|nr:hypothetical protein [bacterium]
MKRLPICLFLLTFSVITAGAQDFSELWVLGDPDNGNQSEFSQEGGADTEPGSAEEQDDDFYFAGTYPDPIGSIGADEDFVNYDRALVPGDPNNRIHFNLDTVGADPGTQLRFSMQLCCFGAVEGNDSIHDLSVRFNGNVIFKQDAVDGDLLVEETFAAGSVDAVQGANVIHIERTDGSGGAWVQFDYLRLEAGAIDSDSDGLPDSYETQFAFLSENDAADAALDEDSDGLTNLGEFMAGADPAMSDTDGDRLSDGDEVNTHNTNPAVADSDSDDLNDNVEVNDAKSDPNVADTDGDTLTDGAEFNTHNTSPLLADTDTDGVDDATEIALSTDPNDASDIPVLFTELWQLGDIDGNQSEFSQEAGANDPPGSAEEQDDDFYFAGTFPAPVGAVTADEPTVNYDRRSHQPRSLQSR